MDLDRRKRWDGVTCVVTVTPNVLLHTPPPTYTTMGGEAPAAHFGGVYAYTGTRIGGSSSNGLNTPKTALIGGCSHEISSHAVNGCDTSNPTSLRVQTA